MNFYELAEQVDWELSPLSERKNDIERLVTVLQKAYRQGQQDENKACAKLIQSCVDNNNLMALLDLYRIETISSDFSSQNPYSDSKPKS